MIKKICLIAFLSLALAGVDGVSAQSMVDLLVRPATITSFNSRDTYRQGVSLYAKQEYAAALMSFDKAIAEGNLSKQNRDVIEFMRAMCRGKLMKENTLAIVNGYISTSTNEVLKNQAKLTVAYTLVEIGDLVAADRMLNDTNPKLLNKQSRTTYYYLRGYLDLNAGERKKAYDNFEKSMEMESEHGPMAQYYMAYIDYLDHNYDKAATTFEALGSNEQYLDANVYLLQIRFLQKDYQRVVNKGLEVLKLPLGGVASSEVTRLIGEAYFNLGDYSNAIRYIDKYIATGGKMTRELYYQIGYSYYMQNMYKKATEQFVKILKGDDALAQNAYYHLADAYLKIGDKSGAIQAFSMASSFSFEPKMAEDALYNYAKLTYEQSASNLYSKKIDVLRKYIDTYPDTARSNELRGYLLTLYLNSSNFNAAMAEFGQIKNPSDEIKAAVQRLCYQKATSYFNNGEYGRATELFDQSIKYPMSQKYLALASFWKAESMFKSGIYDNSVITLYNNYLRVAQPTMKESKMAHYNIGYVYFNNEQWAEAIKSFEKFINAYKTEDGYLQDAYVRLGDAMFAKNSYSAAQLNYKKASAIGVLNSDYADYQSAISEGLMGRNDLKIKTLKDISENGKSTMSDQATIDLASTYIKTGKSAEGVAVLEKMLNQKKESPLMATAMLELGVAYSNSGNDDKALERYKGLIKRYPQSSEAKDALVAIKAIYVSKGDANDYIAYVEATDASGGIDAGEKEELSFEALKRQYLGKNSERTIELADSYKKEFENGVHLADVEYYLAEALIATKSDKAITQIERVINMPNSDYTLPMLASAINFYKTNSMVDKQQAAWAKVYDLTVNPSQKHDALEMLMELAVKTDKKEIILNSCQIVFGDKDASEKALDFANYGQGRTLYNDGKYGDALSYLKKVKIPMSKAEGVQNKYLIADALFKSGDLAGCEKVIVELSNIETPHQYWVARGFILYGDLYKKKGDLFQAKATYQSILDGYEKDTDGIIDLVKTRIVELNTTK